MEDQVWYSKSLTNSGTPAISITNDENPEISQQVLNGNYILVFGWPERFVNFVKLHRHLQLVTSACFFFLYMYFTFLLYTCL